MLTDMADGEMLEIVDENDVVVGKDTRVNIHAKGLLHREVWVQFYTRDGNLIFQHRSKDKDTFPDLLDPTAAGHVEPGSNYLATAVKEVEEETGLRIEPEDLTYIHTMRISTPDRVTSTTNNVFRAVFAYPFSGSLADLQVEKGKALGFERWPLEKVMHLTGEEKKLFVPSLTSPEAHPMYEQLSKLIDRDR
jgi:8-oxo-dGTP diphosphatase